MGKTQGQYGEGQRVSMPFEHTSANIEAFPRSSRIVITFDVDGGTPTVTEYGDGRIPTSITYQKPEPALDRGKHKEAESLAREIGGEFRNIGASLARMFTRQQKPVTVTPLAIQTSKGTKVAVLELAIAPGTDGNDVFQRVVSVLGRHSREGIYTSDPTVNQERPNTLSEFDGDVITGMPRGRHLPKDITVTPPSAADAADSTLNRFFHR